MTGLEMFVGQYGLWVGLGVYILIKDAIPFLTQKVFPARIRAFEEERKARIQQQEDDRIWRRNYEQEQLTIIEKISKSTEALLLNMTQTNERIAGMMTNQQLIMQKQDMHHNASMDAVSDMREEVARRRGMEEEKRRPKTGPLAEKKE